MFPLGNGFGIGLGGVAVVVWQYWSARGRSMADAPMDRIIEEIEAEIARLQAARDEEDEHRGTETSLTATKSIRQ